ncbi:MAG: hypothetical protein SVV67_04910 [Bacillota bacterium]|nr:hypothetical protein [Bacillota bacterium]
MKKLIVYGLIIFSLIVTGSTVFALSDSELSRRQVCNQDENCLEESVREQIRSQGNDCEGENACERVREQNRESENTEANQERIQAMFCGNETEEQARNQHQARNRKEVPGQTGTPNQGKSSSQGSSGHGQSGQ